LLRGRLLAAARDGFLVFAKKQENTGEKVMSFQKGESGNPPAGRAGLATGRRC
jgi:hypothetical protein